MADMKKLKEDALRRKFEHEELERKKQLASLTGNSSPKRPVGKGGSNVRKSGTKRPTSNNRYGSKANSRYSANSKNSQVRGKKINTKPTKSVKSWVIDVLLAIGGLMIVIALISQVL